MEKFAKLFETNGRQLLVKKGTDSDDRPKLEMILSVEGNEFNLGPVFPDTEEGWDTLDNMFDDFNQEKADTFSKLFIGCDTLSDMLSILS